MHDKETTGLIGPRPPRHAHRGNEVKSIIMAERRFPRQQSGWNSDKCLAAAAAAAAVWAESEMCSECSKCPADAAAAAVVWADSEMCSEGGECDEKRSD